MTLECTCIPKVYVVNSRSLHVTFIWRAVSYAGSVRCCLTFCFSSAAKHSQGRQLLVLSVKALFTPWTNFCMTSPTPLVILKTARVLLRVENHTKCHVTGAIVVLLNCIISDWIITSQCYRVQDNGQLFRIVDAQLLDIGSYFCLATNPAGNATKAFSLSVQGMNGLKVMCIEALYSISKFSICCVLYCNFWLEFKCWFILQW